MKKPLVLATRQSALALEQAKIVAHALRGLGEEIEILPLTTTGDDIQTRPLRDIGGKELFVRTLQEAVLAGKADFAVHSLKDMAATTTSGLFLAAVGFGEAANDVLLGRQKLQELPANAVIGTCSPRRSALLRHYAPQLTIKSVRGNVQIILAAAGINRLPKQHQRTVKHQAFYPRCWSRFIGSGMFIRKPTCHRSYEKNQNPKEISPSVLSPPPSAVIATPHWVLTRPCMMTTPTLNAFYETPAGGFLSAGNAVPAAAVECGLRVADEILRRL